jgi:hypothetical protein
MSSNNESTITCGDTFEFARLVNDLRHAFGVHFDATYLAGSQEWVITLHSN